jgi:hypothetical protein
MTPFSFSLRSIPRDRFSAIVFGGKPLTLPDMALERRIELAISGALLSETLRILHRLGHKRTLVCYTRTGRRFFEDLALERELLATVQAALERSGFWDQFKTNWVCLDCELMPWSAKALELVRQQYASVGTAARC